MRASKLTSTLVFAFVISMVLPDNWYDLYHFGEVPVGTVILACLCLALIVGILRSPTAMRPSLAMGLLAMAAMSIGGYLRGNVESYSLKFYVADIFLFSALLAGYTLGNIRVGESTARLVSQISMVASCAIVATYVGLFLGVITTVFNIGGRTMTQSVFYAIGILIILLPWAAVSTRRSDRFGGWRTLFLFSVASGASLLSATRSSTIEVILAAALYLVVKRRHFSFGFILRLAGGVTILLLPLSSGVYSTFVFQRLGSTEFTAETRYAELETWWDQTKDDWLSGQGMGSEFFSPVQNAPALNPHIGIVTYLQKGGVLLFAMCIVLPFFFAVRVLFSPRRPEIERGAAASVLVYMSLACLSGGWDALQLFAFGLAISSMAPYRRRRLPRLRNVPVLAEQLTLQQENYSSSQ